MLQLRAATPQVPLASPPVTLVLWAWERNEDLRFLAGERHVEVAAIMTTVRLVGDRAYVYGRRQRLMVPTGIRVIPVVHIDAMSPDHPVFNDAQRKAIVDAVLAASRDIGEEEGGRVQLDFEIRTSARNFYRRMIEEIRIGSGHLHFSVTALASWCAHDRWMQALNVDEAIPMLFRMGRDGTSIRQRLAATGRLPEPACNSVGISLDEPIPSSLLYSRIYVFSPRSWQSSDYFQIKAKFNTHIDEAS
ncbi:hypothetical protein [Herbaspirillum sp. NPDC087042]|uniref:hypothetical protein n=1 Tax=Herbaspirillum sp. NPDC087042 TaxID=3364004 RepID=UPI0038130868